MFVHEQSLRKIIKQINSDTVIRQENKTIVQEFDLKSRRNKTPSAGMRKAPGCQLCYSGFRQKVAKHRTGMLGDNIRKQLLETEKQH